MTSDRPGYLAQHSAHDPAELARRWSRLSQQGCLTESTLLDDGEFSVVAYETRQSPGARNGLYLCAGVHGDEPAGPWGLLEWAEANVERLRDDFAAVIFPCFNPRGLAENTRRDASGTDLNRAFHDRANPLIAAWHRFMEGRKFRLALHLHEDYDARGIYLYELGQKDREIGEATLRKCEAVIPRDTRPRIDDGDFTNGLLRRTDGIEEIVADRLGGGYPEAIYVHLHHAAFALTFETPSEFSLPDRIRAQRAFIDAAIGTAFLCHSF